jgi:penicillin-binding protein 1A
LGINATIDYIHRFGFATEQLPKDLSLALGSHSLTPFQIASAYTPFANGGFLVKPYLIDRIETLDGTHLYQAAPLTVCRDCQQETPNNIDQPLEEITSIEELLTSDGGAPLPPAPRVIDERVAYIIDDLLKDVVRRGTARKARSLNRNDLAGKTGTTNGPTDAWFSGYGGGIVTTTWVGFDNNQLLGRREYGGSAALPIWIDYMSDALQSRPEQVLPRPAGIVSVKIDPETGLLARPGQRDAIFEIFRDELTPREISPDTETSNPMEVDTPKQEDIF